MAFESISPSYMMLQPGRTRNFYSSISILLCFFLIICSIPSVSADSKVFRPDTDPIPNPLPLYFIAVHNEPFHGDPHQEQKLQAAYSVLREMVSRADEYGLSLTLMFTPQWGTMIGSDPEKLAEVRSWEKNGHEIALHHHSIYHSGWDGYTDYSPDEARIERLKHTKIPEPYLGTLDDMIAALAPLNPDLQSGCANDEQDKVTLPSSITYDTCSGFLNTGIPGERSIGQENGKGVNDFVIVGDVKGTEHKWLSHHIIGVFDQERVAEQEIERMSQDSVFGAITHSSQKQAEPTYKFFTYIHSRDPLGNRSRTLSEIMNEHILPEITLSNDVVNARYPNERVTYDDGGSGQADPKLRDELLPAGPKNRKLPDH